MLIPRVMPCLLLQDGRLVKTVKFKNPSYVGDPVNAIKIYNEKEVDELIVLDIAATAERRPPNYELLRELVDECFMPLCYGGGIRSIEEIKTLLGLGIEKVAINSQAFRDPGLITKAAELYGRQSVVASIDVRRTFGGRASVFTENGRTDTRADPAEYATKMEQLGAGEVLLNSIDRDGTWEGYDIPLIRRVTSAVGIPVIACGGAGKVGDFGQAVKEGGASAVAAGSMVVYQGKGLGVLIRFPTRQELERALARKSSS